jgi:hypothetical protein
MAKLVSLLDHVAEWLVDLAQSAEYGFLRSGQLSVCITRGRGLVVQGYERRCRLGDAG